MSRTVSTPDWARPESDGVEPALGEASPRPHPLADPREQDGAQDVAPVAAYLMSASVELRALQKTASDLEAAVGDLVAHANAHMLPHLRGLQELDRLSQHLGGLSDFLETLSEQSGAGGRIDAGPALSRIKLGRLADALAGRAPHTGWPGDQSGGDVDLF